MPTYVSLLKRRKTFFLSGQCVPLSEDQQKEQNRLDLVQLFTSSMNFGKNDPPESTK